MKRTKIELGDALERYFRPYIGQVPIMIVDTSTIIDLEEKAKRFSTRSFGEVAKILLTDLAKSIKHFIVPSRVLKEVGDHHKYCIKNGRPEISREMYAAICNYAKESRDIVNKTEEFFRTSSPYSAIFDDLELLAKNLHNEINCGKKEKKIKRDPLSDTDMEVITLSFKFAIKSSACLDEKVAEKGDVPDVLKGTCRIAVLSADSHIYRPINKILETSAGLNYRNYLFAFNTRDYA